MNPRTNYRFYSYAGGDPINYIDCTGRSPTAAGQAKALQDQTTSTQMWNQAVADWNQANPPQPVVVTATPVPAEVTGVPAPATVTGSPIATTVTGVPTITEVTAVPASGESRINFSLNAGGSLGPVSYDVQPGNAEINLAPKLGLEIHTGAQAEINLVQGPVVLSAGAMYGEIGMVGLNVDFVDETILGFNVPVPGKISGFIGVGAGGEAHWDPSVEVKLLNINLNNNVETPRSAQ